MGLNTKATAERSFGAGSSYGTPIRGNYNAATFTTTLTWTIPTGTVIPSLGTSDDAPDILFSFRDGLSGKGRITNKVVLASVTGGTIIAPSSTPVGSSVVKDVDRGAVSPTGIY